MSQQHADAKLNMYLPGKLCRMTLALVLCGGPALAQPSGPELRRTPIVDVVEAVRDSIVNISATGLVKIGRRDFGVFLLPLPPIERKVSTVGSGFVMHEAGYIVTNAHVVDHAIDLRVTFSSGREYKAAPLVSDTEHDLAIVLIKPEEPLKPIPLGSSDDLMPGETVIAIGNPLGYANTVTSGIISALGRRIEHSAEVVYENLIQTDASINPGSSGGPLLNILGELIGINTAIRAGAENIGFAIPVSQLRGLLPEMLDFAIAEERHIDLGLRVEGADQPRVVAVMAGSAADQAGIRINDELVRVDDQPVGRDVDFYISMFTLTLNERPKPDGLALARAKFGLVVEELCPRAAEMCKAPADAGVLIMELERRGPAARAGCRPGDLLVRIGRHRISGPDVLGPLLEDVEPDTPADLTLWRVDARGDVWEISRVRLYAR
ncbi:MAG: trypsin-like peptidase domain-containing protein [Planctomycetota bacterium]|jgi:serine protease Do